MSESIENFLEKLKKASDKKSSGSRTYKWINKLRMVLPDNHGIIYGLGVSNENNSPAVILDGVREVKVDGPQSSWVKILPKSYYEIEEGSKEDELYGELCSLHQSMLDESSGISWKIRRWRNYLLIYMYVLKLKHTSGEIKMENTPSLLIFDHRMADKALNNEITAKSTMAGGSFKFMDKFFNRNHEDRKGLITISYEKVNKDVSCSFQFNTINEDHYGITNNQDSLEFNSSYLDLMKDPVNDLLGLDYGQPRFNYEYYSEVRDKMKAMLGHKVDKVDPSTTSTNNQPESSTSSNESDDLPF